MKNQIRNMVRDGEEYLAVLDVLKSSGIEKPKEVLRELRSNPEIHFIQVVEDGQKTDYLSKTFLDQLIEKSKAPPERGDFDKILKGIMDVPKPRK